MMPYISGKTGVEQAKQPQDDRAERHELSYYIYEFHDGIILSHFRPPCDVLLLYYLPAR